jgi:uncharacterized membrane protein
MEEIAKFVTINVSHTVETLAAIIIGIAVLQVLLHFMTLLYKHSEKISKEEIRLQFGSSVAVALELLLGADVLATAVAPSWNDIGQLAAIAVIRTVLNFFLEKELKKMHNGKSNGMLKKSVLNHLASTDR